MKAVERTRPLLILRTDPDRDADRLSDLFARHGHACALVRYRADGTTLPQASRFAHYAGAVVLGSHRSIAPEAPCWQALHRWLAAWTAAARPLLAEGSGAALLTRAAGGTLGDPRPTLGWFHAAAEAPGDALWPERPFIDLDRSLHPPPAASVRLHSRELGVLAWERGSSLALAFPPQLCRSNYADWMTRAGAAGAPPSSRVQTADELRHAGVARLPAYEQVVSALLERWRSTLVEAAG